VPVALDGEEEIMTSPLEYRLERDILRVVSGGEKGERDGNSKRQGPDR